MRSLVRQLRDLTGLTQAQFARELGVGQAAVSLYEGGSRSPNLNRFTESADRLGRRVTILPAELEPAWSRSEQFSRLLYLEVAQQFLSNPDVVRRIASDNLEAMSGDPHSESYIQQWRTLLEPGNEIDLLILLTIPDRTTTGLLSSSPFAGVVDEDTRQQLLKRSRKLTAVQQ